MGTSFVAIGDKGFWMQDSVLSLWLRLLALNLESKPDRADPVMLLRDEWLWQSETEIVGTMDAHLDGAAGDAATKAAVVAAIERLLKALSRHGDELPASTMNLLGFTNSWGLDYQTKGLVEVGNAFLALLAGKIDSEANSTEFMPGSRP
ncbi:hypothetical protein ACFSOZ_27425 [Mesorhizobium newzealandense]|uniref:Uncharacterized protein n=1 Tax=Mesorhizobium newzealandense TaxID=1300302 RepID=A0ABW4UGK0_9HYPH